MIRKKQITIIKMRIKVNIKIKLNQILRDKIKKKSNKIYSKEYDISKFFTTSGKCFPPKIKGKHFPENQAKFSTSFHEIKNMFNFYSHTHSSYIFIFIFL